VSYLRGWGWVRDGGHGGTLGGMPATFTRMDESTLEDWMEIGATTSANQGRVADRMLELLRSLGDITDGFGTDQLTHCLQTATLAERAGADDEVVFAALLHDVGKAISVPNHPAIAAEMIKPYVRPEVYAMIRVHQDFQGRHYYAHFGADPDARENHRDQLSADEWELAERFADEWDQIAFDPAYDTLPLEHFEPLVRKVTAQARM
jgi:predicted HD phosphohydrolase